MPADPTWPTRRRGITGSAVGIAVAVGAYGISFGAVSVATGLTVLQTQVLSALMFTGGSQFALIGVLANGGSPLAAALTSVFLGLRNTFYALRMAPLLRTRGWRRVVAAQLTIDESTGMALRQGDDERGARYAFWATGVGVYVAWNLATLLGSLATSAISDPRRLGLDAAVPAGFLALVWPQLRGRRAKVTGVVAAVVVLLLTPLLPPGAPVLAAAAVAIAVGLRVAEDRPAPEGAA